MKTKSDIRKGYFNLVFFPLLVLAGVFSAMSTTLRNNDDKISSFKIMCEKEMADLDNKSIEIKEIPLDTTFDCLIEVKSQKDFDDLPFNVSKYMPRCNNIRVLIEEGRYYSNTDHIFLYRQKFPKCRLSIVGNGYVVIMATSRNLIKDNIGKGEYTISDNYLDAEVNPENVFTDGEYVIFLSVKNSDKDGGVSFTDELFEKINPLEKQDLRYRLKSDILPNMANEDCKNLWLWATHSWISSYEKIDSIANGYIYLTANREIELYQCPLNTDYKSWRIMPRIKVVNYEKSNSGVYIANNGVIYLPSRYKSIFKCDKGSIIRLEDSEIKSLEVSGIKFVGGNAPLIDVNAVNEYVFIHNCEFTAQQKSAIRLKTNNGFIENNVFKNSCGNIIEIPNEGYRCHFICDNVFTNCGQRLLNHGCLKVVADSVLISNNIFRNNYITSMTIGVWHGQEPKGKITTLVENNLIYNDESFLKEYKSNSLLDVSLLYVCTKNDEVIIRRNRIHGLRTLASGNGIYIDDGAYNVSVYDNIVTGIDGKLYNINCRANISMQAKENAPRYSTNNFLANNIVDGPIRYEIREDENSKDYPKSSYGGNIFISLGYMNFKNKFENVDFSTDKKYQVDDINLIIKASTQNYDLITNVERKRYNNFITKWINLSKK